MSANPAMTPRPKRQFGYRHLLMMLRREGLVLNQTKLFWLYREEKLADRRRGGRMRTIGPKASMLALLRPAERWSLDLMSDQLTDECRIGILTVVNDCTLRRKRTHSRIKLGGNVIW
jgi:putative transposase